MENFIDIQCEITKLSTRDIEIGLRYLPGLIARQSEDVASKREERDKAKVLLNVARAKIMVENADSKHTAKYKEALADVKTEKQQITLVEKEKEYQLSLIKFEELRDKFTSVRKQANILLDERRASYEQT